jgi:hypothetical protein
MSMLRSLLSTHPRQPAGVWSLDPRNTAAAAGTVTQNQAELSRVSLFAPVLIDNIRIINGATVNGNVDVGVYRFDGTNYVRLASSGSVAQTGTSANQLIPLTAGVTVQDGDYLAFASDSATATVWRTTGISPTLVGSPMNLSLIKGSSFPLPATISAPTAGSRTIVMVGQDA